MSLQLVLAAIGSVLLPLFLAGSLTCGELSAVPMLSFLSPEQPPSLPHSEASGRQCSCMFTINTQLLEHLFSLCSFCHQGLVQAIEFDVSLLVMQNSDDH
jgi:hypothetical protein